MFLKIFIIYRKSATEFTPPTKKNKTKQKNGNVIVHDDVSMWTSSMFSLIHIVMCSSLDDREKHLVGCVVILVLRHRSFSYLASVTLKLNPY